MNTKDKLIYGIRPVIESIKARKEIDKVFIRKDLKGELLHELYALLKDGEIPYQHVPIEKLNRLTRKNHQGVICYISEIEYQPIEEIIPAIFEKGETPLILVLDRITDVRNFGSIARTAECAGVHVILIPSQGSAAINSDALKTSAGALNRIPVSRTKNLKKTLDFLKNSGLQIIATSEKGEKYYNEINLTGPTAFLMGSEENGVSDAYLKKADEIVKIPILGKIESLNVSVATGVIIYETVRQRNREIGKLKVER